MLERWNDSVVRQGSSEVPSQWGKTRLSKTCLSYCIGGFPRSHVSLLAVKVCCEINAWRILCDTIMRDPCYASTVRELLQRREECFADSACKEISPMAERIFWWSSKGYVMKRNSTVHQFMTQLIRDLMNVRHCLDFNIPLSVHNSHTRNFAPFWKAFLNSRFWEVLSWNEQERLKDG